ncbi:late sexual development protein [Metarhizium album ARSEF 1941]|uniref:Late sexual development protein n=1 Tax=Metarhizium album (strain ARSEF 1941) TaxID=1081103 RepID=A0A0B2WSW0_METAS|nr:late sexual development protein [Metarhizium album ARSEF 1941]KHN96045.1 late sexual development protein [Metarhizium album ARSEF 1941]
MAFKLLSKTALLGLALGAAVPNNNGFPMPNDQQKLQIAQQAGGLLPGGPAPKSLGPDSITAFQLIAFNELFETAYFSSLLHNITSDASGYQSGNKTELVKIFSTVLAQEQQHALAAVSTLEAVGAFAPQACQYQFPVSDLRAAVNLAETFTAVVLGALQGANVILGQDQQPGPVRIISSVIGQEGEQNGFYRVFLDQVPSESPFLTTVPAPFAWSALQAFVVPGSCPFPLSKIKLPILPPLAVNGGPIASVEPQDQTLSFVADVSGSEAAKACAGREGLFATYTTGQQLPISVAVTDVEWSADSVSFKAHFPFSEFVMQGFTHVALTTSNNFDSPDAVVQAALAGPGLIQASNRL